MGRKVEIILEGNPTAVDVCGVAFYLSITLAVCLAWLLRVKCEVIKHED